jgi:hypothetical protein
MVKVEFRLLQVILSPVSGDRVTVALLHWDGALLRVASSTAALRALERDHREGLRVAIQEAVRKAERKARSLAEEPVLDMGLAHVFPVREGFGAALYWAPITSVETADAEAHFTELRRELRLEREPLGRTRRMTYSEIYDELTTIGRKMRLDENVQPWVRTDYVVKLETSYKPPVSWKNGRWHHAVPMSLDGLRPPQMDEVVQHAYGLVELSFPKSDVAVLVPVLPRESALEVSGQQELDILRGALGSRVEVVAPQWHAGKLALDSVVVRIRQDIARSH